MFHNIALLVLAAVMIGTSALSMAAPTIPAGTEVILMYQSGDQVLCRVGQEEGLFYPADPTSPANYAACDATFPLRGLNVTVAGLPAVCVGTTLVPMRPTNCVLGK